MTDVRVLIVEDSAAARRVICTALRSIPGVSIFGQATDPFEAAALMKTVLPDVILLDLQLPRMDGLTFLRRIMAQRPIPVVVFSNHTEAGSANAEKALKLGACDVILKPDFSETQTLATIKSDLTKAILAAAECHRQKAADTAPSAPNATTSRRAEKGPKLTADAILPLRTSRGVKPASMQSIIAIGASTGGTDAVGNVLSKLDKSGPPIVIVQHMPEHFTTAFAKRLDGICSYTVREAADGDRPAKGLALIAPGNRHMVVAQQGTGYRITIVDGPQVSRHRPAVDVLFRSVAGAAGPYGLGILMTGMGDDGARGLLEMKEAGAETLIQDQNSSVVWGMPGEAWKIGASRRVVPLSKIPAEINRFSSRVIAT